MIEFFRANAPIIILFALYGFVLFMAIFKPRLINKMRYNIIGFVGPVGGGKRTSKQVSRIGFLGLGSPFLAAAIGMILNRCKLIGHDRFLHIFVAGFVMAGMGVVYDMCRRN
jgi:hypothetical protein